MGFLSSCDFCGFLSNCLISFLTTFYQRNYLLILDAFNDGMFIKALPKKLNFYGDYTYYWTHEKAQDGSSVKVKNDLVWKMKGSHYVIPRFL